MISPADRITLIRKSLTVFVCGLLSLVPFIGVVPAAFAFCGAARLVRFRHEWNPASAYMRWGAVSALLGVGITALVSLVIALNIIAASGADQAGF